MNMCPLASLLLRVVLGKNSKFLQRKIGGGGGGGGLSSSSASIWGALDPRFRPPWSVLKLCNQDLQCQAQREYKKDFLYWLITPKVCMQQK